MPRPARPLFFGSGGAAAAPPLPKNKMARGAEGHHGPNLGVGVRHALFPKCLRLALSLSRAAGSPTPLRTACAGFGLMAGPLRPLPAGVFRVRPLCPVRSLSAESGSPDRVLTRLQTTRVGTVTTGSAPAFGRALAPCYGSDLLPLRLPLLCSRVTRFFAPPGQGRLRALPDSLVPRVGLPVARLPEGRPCGGVDPPGNVVACRYLSRQP